MALLSSCYCGGQVAVVVGTTIVLGLLGPGLFSLLMGIGRFAYGRWGSSLGLRRLLLFSSVGAVIPTIFAVVVWRFGKVRHTSAVPAGARPKP